jgi:L-threonylcarbamoyladenylate synthase
LARILPDDASSVSAAASAVRNGRLVSYPTDTVYGLGCDPWNEDAVGRLFEAKGRDAKPVPVLFAEMSGVEEAVTMNETAAGLGSKYWPGALTIVAPLRRRVPYGLDQGSGWLGVRIPDHPVARSLAREAGGSVTGTSANLSGRPSCTTAAEVQGCLGDRLELIIDGGRSQGGQSTVVKVVGRSVEVLRRGSIGLEPGTVRESFNR